MESEKMQEFLERIKQVILQLDEGAITDEECYNYILIKASVELSK